MTTYAPTTELEAVNVMLSVIGEAPVSSLNLSGFSDVAIAQSILLETSREVQSEQWSCNTEENYELVPNTDGHITIPSNVLKLDTSWDYEYKYKIVQRGPRAYDKIKHTYVFTEPVKFDITWFLPFTDLTETLRRYITVAAARKFQKRFYGSDTIDGFTQEDEFKAKANALSSDGYEADYNMTANYSVYNILMR